MVTMSTFSGEFEPFAFRPEYIHIEDIARGLAHTARWRGQTERFYSVAEHSIMVACQCSDPLRLWGLLHDAAEAYLSDIPAPYKDLTWFHVPDERGVIQKFPFVDLEDGILRHILAASGIHVAPGAATVPQEVHDADQIIRRWEYNTLVRPMQGASYTPLTPGEAMEKWIQHYWELVELQRLQVARAAAI